MGAMNRKRYFNYKVKPSPLSRLYGLEAHCVRDSVIGLHVITGSLYLALN